MKGKILDLLRAEGGILSGERISAELGISRVSVWKHIKKLQELGYPIAATAKGYRLTRCFDALFPWEFGQRESNIHYHEEADSTMDIARKLAREGCPGFTTVIAGRQRKGRGRLKRVWHSSAGGLYFTLVTRPPIPPVISPRIGFAASVVLAQTLRRLFDVMATVKWPNDILVGDRKLSGMLSELEAEADRVAFINVGIGINVNNDPTPIEPSACSLKQLLKKDVSRKKLLSEFLDEFENRMTGASFENVISQWKQYTSTIGRFVRIVTGKEISEGMAVDVDENGALVLELADGSKKQIAYGDCFH
jgi:BirA family biotin operon repressor/biotin-[acetyl-CoA-carboxylase] ligase